MPNAQQLKALLQSHIDGDSNHFYSVAMQVAASEAKLGHGKVAKELRALIDNAKSSQNKSDSFQAIPLAKPRGELSGLLSVTYPKIRMADMILPLNIQNRLLRLIQEHSQIKKIRSYGLSPRKKLLLIGLPGTGKTLTASVLSGELGLPLFTVHLDSLITKYMGETAAKLRLIFDAIMQTRGVYLFDEFDSIGSKRELTNDVGEIRRVLNSFLQMIEQDDSDSLLVAATNYGDLLDKALFRRFDDILEYQLPSNQEIIDTFQSKLASFKLSRVNWEKLSKAAKGLSYADINRVCEDSIKEMLINNKKHITQTILIHAANERQSFHQK
ncbi:MAG: ATP-binding protein [Pseudomonadota bacterium]